MQDTLTSRAWAWSSGCSAFRQSTRVQSYLAYKLQIAPHDVGLNTFDMTSYQQKLICSHDTAV